MRVEKDFEELLRLFNKYGVRYCIVGAFAVGFYAKPRYTKDMDIFVEAASKNGGNIVSALREFGFGSLDITPKDFTEEDRFIQLGYEPIRIDLMTAIPGCTFKQIWKNKKIGYYGRQKVPFIGISDLIKNKKASKRKQDEADLELLLEIQRRPVP